MDVCWPLLHIFPSWTYVFPFAPCPSSCWQLHCLCLMSHHWFHGVIIQEYMWMNPQSSPLHHGSNRTKKMTPQIITMHRMRKHKHPHRFFQQVLPRWPSQHAQSAWVTTNMTFSNAMSFSLGTRNTQWSQTETKSRPPPQKRRHYPMYWLAIHPRMHLHLAWQQTHLLRLQLFQSWSPQILKT